MIKQPHPVDKDVDTLVNEAKTHERKDDKANPPSG
jgi:hypothetical protein